MNKLKYSILVLIAAVVSLSAQGKQPQTGYRGFVDWDSEVFADIALYGGPTNSKFYTGFTTTHGYQLKEWLFIGGGTGLIFWPKESQIYSLPVYGSCRVDLGKRRISPFFEVRLGCNTVHGAGVYFASCFGLGWRFYKDFGVNIAIGYTMNGSHQYYTYLTYDDPSLNHYGWVDNSLGHNYDNSLSLRLGIEF